MIKAINFLGNTEAPGAVSNVAAPKADVKAEAPVTNPSAPAQEAPQADPNDKFVKSEDKKPEEAK